MVSTVAGINEATAPCSCERLGTSRGDPDVIAACHDNGRERQGLEWHRPESDFSRVLGPAVAAQCATVAQPSASTQSTRRGVCQSDCSTRRQSERSRSQYDCQCSGPEFQRPGMSNISVIAKTTPAGTMVSYTRAPAPYIGCHEMPGRVGQTARTPARRKDETRRPDPATW